MALGIEHLQAVDLFGDTGKLDGRAGDLPHRQRRTAARVAVELGQHNAGEGQRLLEGLGGVDRVLPLHRIDHEQGFNRVQRGVQVLDFFHQGFVNGQAAGRINQQHVEVVLLGVVERSTRDIQRLLVGRAGEPLGARLLGHSLELLDGGRAVHVARDGQHLFLALFDQVLGQLGCGGGLARALQARHQDDGRGLGGEVDVGDALAHSGGQLAVDDGDQRLPGLERAQHLLAQRLVLHAGDEVAHHGQGHVGLQQGHAHLAQHVLHVGFGDAGLAAHLLDEAREFVGKGGGHRGSSGVACARSTQGRGRAGPPGRWRWGQKAKL